MIRIIKKPRTYKDRFGNIRDKDHDVLMGIIDEDENVLMPETIEELQDELGRERMLRMFYQGLIEKYQATLERLKAQQADDNNKIIQFPGNER